MRRDEEKAAKVRSIGTGVRRASPPKDEGAIGGLLDLNGVPRRPAAEEGFLVAGASGEGPSGLRGELPEGGWRRMLALLGVQTVPFFRAFPR